MKEINRLEAQETATGLGTGSAIPVRHALRDQDALWDDFLAMGLTAVDSLSKSISVLCEGASTWHTRSRAWSVILTAPRFGSSTSA